MIVILEYHRPMWALCNVFGPYASPILWWYAVQPLHCSMGNAQCWQCLSTAEIHFFSFVFVLWGKTWKKTKKRLSCKIHIWHAKYEYRASECTLEYFHLICTYLISFAQIISSPIMAEQSCPAYKVNIVSVISRPADNAGILPCWFVFEALVMQMLKLTWLYSVVILNSPPCQCMVS